jgi:hypothetical protein
MRESRSNSESALALLDDPANRKIRPTFFGWTNEKYDSKLGFVAASVYSAIKNGVAGLLVGGVIDFAGFVAQSQTHQANLSTEQLASIPLVLAAAGVAYGGLKRMAYLAFSSNYHPFANPDVVRSLRKQIDERTEKDGFLEQAVGIN